MSSRLQATKLQTRGVAKLLHYGGYLLSSMTYCHDTSEYEHCLYLLNIAVHNKSDDAAEHGHTTTDVTDVGDRFRYDVTRLLNNLFHNTRLWLVLCSGNKYYSGQAKWFLIVSVVVEYKERSIEELWGIMSREARTAIALCNDKSTKITI